jgi:hypothetical protein
MKAAQGIRVLCCSGLVLGVLLGGCGSKNDVVHPLIFNHHKLFPSQRHGIAGWKLIGRVQQSELTAGEGVVSVTHSHGPQTIDYRGFATIPEKEKATGWTHIGDPDGFFEKGVGEVIIDNFQGSPTKDEKLYVVTTPNGKTIDYLHHDVRGELYNNSFDTISPNGQWMVSGTWTTERTLEIFPTPYLNKTTARNGGTLLLSGSIKLDHDLYDVQGCDFLSPIELLCLSTGNLSMFSNTKLVLQITLTHPINGKTVTGHVSDLGTLPQHSKCQGTFEAEGIDYDQRTGVLRAEITQPGDCVFTTIYEYKKVPSSS